MSKLEPAFSDFIQREYRQHDDIQKNEAEKLERKSIELNRMDDLAEVFEYNMELAAYQLEQWLIKHKRD